MQCFAFFSSYALLLTIVGSNHIDEEIHSEAFKSKLWPTDHTLTRKLDDDDSLSDSMMSPFYRVILPNEMLPKQDQDSIQALYGKKKNAIASVHPSRRVRSIEDDVTITTKKKKKPKRKPKKKPKPPKTTTEKVTTRMTDAPQLITFDADDQAKVSKAIKEVQPDTSLSAFSGISGMIKKATGMLPTEVIPILQELSGSYSKTTMMIKVNFADTVAILSKFILKSYRVMKRGMNNADKNILMDFEKQLNTDIINKLDTFVETARTELVEIHKQLLLKAHGAKAEDLLKKRDGLEAALLRRSADFANVTSEYGINQGHIDSLSYEKQIFEKAVENSDIAREDAKKELKRLKEQITDYENKVQQHRDTRREERGSFWIFSWKVRDVHTDNGEKIARENLNRLLDRIRALEKLTNDWPNTDLTNRVKDARNKLAKHVANSTSLTLDQNRVKGLYEKAKDEFYDVDDEIKALYKSVGTSSLNSLKVIDELCIAVQSGQESIVSAYGKIRIHLKVIAVDEDFLVNSVLDALQFLSMADAYMGTTRIHNLKQALALE